MTTVDTSKQEIGFLKSSFDKEIFSEYKPAQFTVAGLSYGFPVVRIEEAGGNRLIERERPYRNGAKLDDTGSKAKRWTLEAIFENTISDDGLSALNGQRELYPDVLNAIVALFDVHETGDLVVPTVGPRRVRADTYVRIEAAEQRDCAVLRLTFVEDNEDSVDASSISPPSASGNARRLAESTTFSAQTMGGWSEAFGAIEQLMADLEALVNSPIDNVNRVNQSSRQIQGHATRIVQTFSRPDRQGRNLLLDPSNNVVERKLVMQIEMAARAANEARKGRPKLVQVVFREPTSLFRIATVTGQSFEDLANVNPQTDPFNVAAGEVVNVFASEELLNGKRQTA